MLNRQRHGASMRTKLLFALGVVCLASVVIAAVGWFGLRNTESAMSALQRDILPDISSSLVLAERTASLAALAPYVAEAVTPFQVQRESEELKSRQLELTALATQIHHLDQAPQLQHQLAQMNATLSELINHTEQELFLREDILQTLYAINQRFDQLARFPQLQPLLPGLLDKTHLIINVSGSQLDNFTQPLRDQLARLRQQYADDAVPLALPLQQLTDDSNALIEQKRHQSELLERKTFLLAAVRANSAALSDEVRHFVEQLQQRLSDQQQQLSRAVQWGQSRILLLTLLALLMLIIGIFWVLDLSRHLKTIAQQMSLLAQGVTDQSVPSSTRHDEVGSLTQAFLVFRQRTMDLQALTADLQQQTRLLETVFANINDGLSVFDSDNRLLAWNPQYLALFSLPVEHIRAGMYLDEIQTLMNQLPHHNRTLDNSPLDMVEINLRRQAEPQRFERYFHNGQVLEFRSRPMPDGGFVTLYSDLTERKAIESQLRQAQKMDVLGQLTGGVAHDFNNLLSAIIGNLQLLQEAPAEQPLDERSLRLSQRALAAAEKGAGLVQRLLAFARRQHLQPEAVQVNELLEAMLDLIEYSVGPQISIEVQLCEDDPWIYVDASQLDNSLLNLVLNACAAMPDGGQLTLRTSQSLRAEKQDSDWVLIEVQDSGHGIAEEVIDRIFEPFFTTKAVGQGSGLGLSMVYGFVRQSGGDISVSSSLGEGTTFQLWLPLHHPQQRTSGALPDGPLPMGNLQHILLVEDDQQVQLAAIGLLEHLHYRVTAVNSASEARELLHSAPTSNGTHDYALLLSDINLGTRESGIELAHFCQHHYPTLPVLLTSGLPKERLLQDYGLASELPLLPKPYRLDTLARKLAECLTA